MTQIFCLKKERLTMILYETLSLKGRVASISEHHTIGIYVSRYERKATYF